VGRERGKRAGELVFKTKMVETIEKDKGEGCSYTHLLGDARVSKTSTKDFTRARKKVKANTPLARTHDMQSFGLEGVIVFWVTGWGWTPLHKQAWGGLLRVCSRKTEKTIMYCHLKSIEEE